MMRKIGIVLPLVFGVFNCCVLGEDLSLSYDDSLDYVPGEVIVKYKDSDQNLSTRGIKSTQLDSLSILSDQLKTENLEVKDELDSSSNVVLVEINDDKTVEETIELLSDNPNIEYVEPNYIRYLHYMEDFDSNDSSKGQQRGLQYISRTGAYNAYSGVIQDAALLNGSGRIVAVVDNGVNYNHSDLSNSMWDSENGKCNVDGNIVDCIHGYDFIHNQPTPLPNFSRHGTHIAGIIAAGLGNGTGIIGVNPYAKIAALKIGNGKLISSADELRAINFAINNGIKIINASYGGSQFSSSEKNAIERFGQAGGLFVAAAGNGDRNNHGLNLEVNSEYPCKYDLDNIICVAAIDAEGELTYYSNYGNKSVDIAAPGTNIYSTIVRSATSGMVLREFFGSCSASGQAFPTWGSGTCYKWKKSQGYGLLFSGSVMSPVVDASNHSTSRNDLYLSFSASCYGGTLGIQYMSGETISDMINLGNISSSGTNFSLHILDDYLVDEFRFKLTVSGGTYPKCAIDNVEIINEPYVDDDNDSYGNDSGTSMATPYVAGLASLLWMVNPDLSYLDIKNFILNYGDDNATLTGKLVSGKTINVKKSLEAVIKDKIGTPSGLISSWTGVIQWDISAGAVNYYYELYNENDEVELSGYTTGTGLETGLTGNYSWKVRGFDSYGNESDFGLSYICEKPILQDITVGVNECVQITGNIGVNDNCVGMYRTIRLNDIHEETTGNVIMNGTGNVLMTAYVQNAFGEQTDAVNVSYTWNNALPSLSVSTYNYPSTITSTSSKNLGNVIDLFGAADGECGKTTISVNSYSCDKGTVSLQSNDLYVSAPSSSQGSAECTIVFKDDEGYSVEGKLKYNYNTVPSSSGGGGGGGGSGNSGSSKTDDTHKVAEDDTNKTGTGENEELEKPVMRELFDDEQEEKEIDFSWYNKSDSNSIMGNGYTVEFNNAFQFARQMGITTTNSIEEANMGGKLTRIAMAKMLSQYAINVLGKKPDIRKRANFGDVSQSLDRDYNNGVTLAYQLGIMGVGIDNFRPNDNVTRGEFATALSRMLYGLADGNPYYFTHINKLHSEGIITNSDPKIKEMRGYVMIMLMRSAMK